MSHQLSIIRGIVEMFSGREIRPWHGLGQIVKGLLTSKQAIKAAHLDWGVEKRNLFYLVAKNTSNERAVRSGASLWIKSNRVSLVRADTDDELAVVSDDYEIFQNSEAFRFFDAIIGEGRAAYDTAGALFGGKYVWILCKLNPDDFKQRKTDQIDHYVLLSNNFGQRQVLTMRQCATRVVCWNTHTAALNEKQSVISIPHRGDLQAQVERAREGLGIITQSMRELEAVLDEIRGIKMNERELQSFAYQVTPESEPEQEAIRYLFKKGIGCEGKTRYDAWNAVTQLTTHHLGARGTDEMKAQRRFNSVMTGRGHQMQKRALGLLMP